MAESAEQASLYAEKIAKMLFTAPDGQEGRALILDGKQGDPYLSRMNWDYVVNNIRRILEA